MRKKSKKTIEREKDKEWREKILKRDKSTCQITGKKIKGRNCQVHHIIPKQFKELRWDVNNGIVLSFQSHKVGKYSAHLNALFFTQWLITKKPLIHKYLIEKLNETI